MVQESRQALPGILPGGITERGHHMSGFNVYFEGTGVGGNEHYDREQDAINFANVIATGYSDIYVEVTNKETGERIYTNRKPLKDDLAEQGLSAADLNRADVRRDALNGGWTAEEIADAKNEPTYTVDIPGAAFTHFEGTGVMQGGARMHNGTDSDDAADADLCLAAWRAATKVKRGKGYSYRMVGLTIGAVWIIRGHADMLLEICNYGTSDPGEKQAAIRMLTRLDALLAAKLAADRAADAAKLAKLTPAMRDAVNTLQSHCPAPNDYAVAYVDMDGLREIRQVSGRAGDDSPAKLVADMQADYACEPGTLVDMDAALYAPLCARCEINPAQRRMLGAMCDSSLCDPCETGLEVCREDGSDAATVAATATATALDMLPPDGDTAKLVAAWARAFASECEWEDTDAEEIAGMSDAAVIRAAARHYDGGMSGLVRDALEDAKH